MSNREGKHLGTFHAGKKELEVLRSVYVDGKIVTAIDVEGVEKGTKGVILGVKNNGNIEVFWDVKDGFIKDVVYMEGVVVVDGDGCMLRRKIEFFSGGCDGMECKNCGWNYDVATKRKMMIGRGEMKENKNGQLRLVV